MNDTYDDKKGTDIGKNGQKHCRSLRIAVSVKYPHQQFPGFFGKIAGKAQIPLGIELIGSGQYIGIYGVTGQSSGKRDHSLRQGRLFLPDAFHEKQ